MALESLFQIHWQYLRAYDVKHLDSWSAKLDRSSYEVLTGLYKERDWPYETLEPLEDAKRRSKKRRRLVRLLPFSRNDSSRYTL